MFEVDEEGDGGGRQSLLSRTPPAALCTGGVSTLRSHTVREARPEEVASTEDKDRNLGQTFSLLPSVQETDAITAICSMLLKFMHRMGQGNPCNCLLSIPI